MSKRELIKKLQDQYQNLASEFSQKQDLIIELIKRSSEPNSNPQGFASKINSSVQEQLNMAEEIRKLSKKISDLENEDG